jgi:3-hydroxyisobutyrate dehydrogenase
MTEPAETTIGFIGLGIMGGPMATNLLKAGHPVVGYDVVPAALEKFAAAGGKVADSVAAVTAEADVVITMLPAGAPVREVYLGSGGIIESTNEGTLLIDCSTIDVATARDVADAATKKGQLMIDAPVSGGVGGAQGGTLTFMVGGADEAFNKAKPVLEFMGKTIVHAGPAGNGQAAKICNNMILGISMIGVAEAFVLAEKLGLSHQALFDVASTSSGQCWSLTSYCPVPGPVPSSPANRGYRAGFTAAMMAKDLRLAQDAAQSVDAPTPMGAQARSLYALFANRGHGGLDFSAIIRMIAGDL